MDKMTHIKGQAYSGHFFQDDTYWLTQVTDVDFNPEIFSLY